MTDERSVLNVDSIDAGGSRSATAPVDELREGISFSLGIDRDATIRLIAGVPRNAQPLGLSPRRLPEIHPLDQPFHPDDFALPVAHRCFPVAG